MPSSSWRFERLLDIPVRSLAFGDKGHAALLSDVPHLFDGHTWQAIPLPERLGPSNGEQDDVQLFFGRDNQPRLMGTRTAPDGSTQRVYLRHFRSGWRAETAELGPLGQARSLYGILGYADPEVVCETDGICLVKRLSGWGRTQADKQRVRMFLTDAGVYKQAEGKLWLLTQNSFAPVASLAAPPTSLCRDREGSVWMTLQSSPELLRVPPHSSIQQIEGLPLSEVHCVFCSATSLIWLGGAKHAAHSAPDGWRVTDEVGLVSTIAAPTPDVIWLGSEQGLFVGHAPQPE